MWYLVMFILGMMAGAFTGIIILSMCQVAKDDKYEENENPKKD